MKNKRSQGEIFGIALMFVVIIVGILVYSQIKALNPDRTDTYQREAEYEILAQRTLNTMLSMSTGCYVERGRDSVKDLVNFCLDYTYSGNDPTMDCFNNGEEVKVCAYAKDIINTTLVSLYNKSSSSLVGEIPYQMTINVPNNANTKLSNTTFTNFGEITYRGTIIDDSSYRKLGYKKATSGLITWATSQRNVEFELYLYYR